MQAMSSLMGKCEDQTVTFGCDVARVFVSTFYCIFTFYYD